MKNLFKVLIPLGILGAIAFAATGTSLKRLLVYLKRIRIKNVKLAELNLLIDLVIENPNIRPVTLEEIDGEVIFNDVPVARIQLYNQNIRIPAREQKILPDLLIRIGAAQAANQVWSYIENKSGKVLIKGTLKANSMTFPFSNEASL